jgi:twinkle protein
MLKLKPYEIESYLKGKCRIRRRGQKAELEKCPFCQGGEHNDRWTFVCYLDESGGNFKCMRGSCDQTGSFWQLAEQYGDDPKDFYERREDDRRRNFSREIDSTITAELKANLTFRAETVKPQKLTAEALKYLEARGFHKEVLDEVSVWCDEQGLINFGYYHKGELCMVKVRQPRKPAAKEQKAWQKWKGGLRTLWGLEQCDLTKKYLIITFGEYDRIAVQQARLENVVSVPCGDSDLEWINVCYDELKDLKEIYLWTDNDEAGRLALPKIAARLGAHKIKVVDTEYKDANEMLLKIARKDGAEAAANAVFEAVMTAKWFHKGDVIDFADIEEVESSFEGFKTGISLLDKQLGGLLFGRLTVITGDTKSGKTTGVNQIVLQAAAQGAIVCGWFGEDEPHEYKNKTYVHLAGYEGIDTVTSNTGAFYSRIKPAYKDAVNAWTRGKLYILTRKSGIDEQNLIANFRLAFERYGCNMFVVDNLMKLVAAKDAHNLNFRQTQVVNSLSDFAKETGSHVFLVTHTNKEQSEERPPKSIREVSGAKEIVNLCDSLISVWRVPEHLKHDYGNAKSVWSILANRVFHETGAINLDYDWRIKAFAEGAEGFRDLRYSI